jgi:diacylglycerol kinase family enzyme
MPRGRRPYAALYANRRAGWQKEEWHNLDDWALEAGIKSYVLTDIEEMDPIIARFGEETTLLFIFGGDGTVFRVLNSWINHHGAEKKPLVVTIGGGTMKRLPRRTRWIGTPAENARIALKLFESGSLAELPLSLLEVKRGSERYFAATFIAGAPVRVMRQYSRFKTTPFIAGAFAFGSVMAGLAGRPKFFTGLYGQINAKVTVDGAPLPEERFIVVIKDVLEKLIFFIEPYKGVCRPGQSYSLAYAANYQEIARRFGQISIGRPPDDPRYFNQPTSVIQIEPREEIPFTLDGEFFTARPGETITISQGPEVRVAMNPFAHLTLLRRFLDRGERLKDALSYVIPTPKEE